MKPDRIENHIDMKILDCITRGNNLSEVVLYLKSNCDKFMKRDMFVNISKKYILTNWDLIEIRKRYTTYYVIHSTKRKNDIEWVLKNKENFEKNITDTKLFKLILLKDKLK
jgi:hypothetical protein